MSSFESISVQELEIFRDRLIAEVEPLRLKILSDLDLLEKKSLELNEINIEIEERNAKG